MTADVVLAFHYRGTENFRREAFNFTRTHYERLLRGLPVVVADSGHEKYNRAASRNQAVRTAVREHDPAVVVLLDADVLIPPAGLHTAIEHVLTYGGYARPFHRSRNLTLNALQTVTPQTWPTRGQLNDPGAAYVITPATWQLAGGMDENYTLWGGEDESFTYALNAHGVQPHTTSRLPALKLAHPASRWGGDGWRTTYQRESIYQALREDRTRMTQWISERDQPEAVDSWLDRVGIRATVDLRLARKWRL